MQQNNDIDKSELLRSVQLNGSTMIDYNRSNEGVDSFGSNSDHNADSYSSYFTESSAAESDQSIDQDFEALNLAGNVPVVNLEPKVEEEKLLTYDELKKSHDELLKAYEKLSRIMQHDKTNVTKLLSTLKDENAHLAVSVHTLEDENAHLKAALKRNSTSSMQAQQTADNEIIQLKNKLRHLQSSQNGYVTSPQQSRSPQFFQPNSGYNFAPNQPQLNFSNVQLPVSQYSTTAPSNITRPSLPLLNIDTSKKIIRGVRSANTPVSHQVNPFASPTDDNNHQRQGLQLPIGNGNRNVRNSSTLFQSLSPNNRYSSDTFDQTGTTNTRSRNK